MKVAALTLLLLAGMGLAGAATGHGAPAEVRTGGTLLDARRVTFAALAGLERRGYAVDRSLLAVRVIPKGHVCQDYAACADMNRYTGERTVWLSRYVVQQAVVIQPSVATGRTKGSALKVQRRRTPSCLAWQIATHEWLHHAKTLTITFRYAFDGYLSTRRDGYTTDEYDAEHEEIERLAEAFTAQAERNGRCVDVAA